MGTFSDMQRSAPKEPGWTCPHIDGAIKTVKDAVSALEDLTTTWGELEKVREMNAALRECADYWKEQAETAADKLDEAQERIGELERELEAAAQQEAA